MVKLTYSSDISDSVGVGGEIVKSSSDLKKQASTIFDCEYDALKPPEGKTGIHLVALGEMETYGFNRNADGWKKSDCKNRCDTFVKHGHVYQHHRNTDPKKAIGEIKAAAYNPEMGRIELYIWADNEKAHDHLERLEKTGEVPFSMAARVLSDTCFPKGTFVLTEIGYQKIEEISIGDRVITDTGTICEVVATSVRQTSKLTRVNVSGFPLDIECTPNHPFKVVKSSKILSCRGSANGKKRRHTFGNSGTCVCCHKAVDVSSEWVQASEIADDDYLKIKVPQSSSSDSVGTSFAYLSGQYVGDGSFLAVRRGHNRAGEKRIIGLEICASAASDDAGIITKIANVVSSVTGKEVRVHPESYGRKAYGVVVHDQLVANRICSLFGSGSRTKYISPEVESWSKREKAAFVAGLIDSDGCVTASKHTVRIVSVNRGLALSIQRICWSLGIRATCYIAQSDESIHGVFGSKGPCYGVQFSEFIPEFFEYCDKLSRYPWLKDAKTCGSTILMADGYVYLRVRGTHTFDSDSIDVYNIEVEKDHTYNAEGADVHNCSICGATRKGPGDKNECDHIKYELGKIAEDGKFTGMINNDPVWFDISFVGRPADRIAWNLKTASGLIDSVKAAEYEGVVLPDDIAIESKGGLRKQALVKDLASVYSNMVGWLKSASCKTHDEKYLFEMRKLASLRVPDGILSNLRSYSPRDTFEALADAGVVLDTRSFFKYAMGQEYATVEPYVAEIEKAAGLILKQAAEGSCATLCNSTEFDPYPSDDFRRKPLPGVLVAKLAEYGMDNPDSKILDVTLSGETPRFRVDESDEKGVSSSVSTKLAEKYVAYKLAAIDAVLNSRYGVNRNKNHLAAISAAQDLKQGE